MALGELGLRRYSQQITEYAQQHIAFVSPDVVHGVVAGGEGLLVLGAAAALFQGVRHKIAAARMRHTKDED